MSILALDNVSKKFGSVQALSGLTLKFNGGVLGLIGPNGSGKTTTINILGGFIRPDIGRVEVFGLDPWRDRSKIFLRMGLLPDEIYLPKGLTGYNLLRNEAMILGIRDINGRIEEVSQLLGIGGFLHRRIGSYSSGMYKRLLLARTLLNPDIDLIVLDEPFSNIDVESIVTISKVVQDLRKKGKNFLIASHILPHLLPICSEYAVILDGKIVVKGSFSQLFSEIDEYHYLIRVDKYIDELIDHIKSIEGVKRIESDELGIHIITHNPRSLLMRLYECFKDFGVYLLEATLYPDPLTHIFLKLGVSNEDR